MIIYSSDIKLEFLLLKVKIEIPSLNQNMNQNLRDSLTRGVFELKLPVGQGVSLQ